MNVTQRQVTLTYNLDLDLTFLTISSVGLVYTKPENQAGTTQIQISGSFLGETFGTEGKPPLSWDPVNEQPPAVPGGGSSLLDVAYLGLGQRVTFTDPPTFTSVQQVIDFMKTTVIPAGNNELPSGVQFSSTADWLIGADLTVMKTVTLGIVFNDPNLYGLLVSLGG